MKRYLAATLALLLCLCSIFAVAFADEHPLAAQFSSSTQDILYLDDGRIAYALYDGDAALPLTQRTISSIVCTDGNGSTQWKCAIPTAVYTPFSKLVKIDETNEFAYLGKSAEEGHAFFLTLISDDGNSQKTFPIPEAATSPILSADGLWVAFPNESKIEKQLGDKTILTIDLNGIFLSRIDNVASLGDHTYISAVSNSEQLLLCIDSSNELAWSYTLGKGNYFPIYDWCEMDDGSLIISCQIIEKTGADSITGYNPLIAINNGEKQWEAKLPWFIADSRPEMLLSNGDNTYSLLGRMDKDHGYCFTFDHAGNDIGCVTVDVPNVDFIRYKQSIYAIGYNTNFMPTILVSYDSLPKTTIF